MESASAAEKVYAALSQQQSQRETLAIYALQGGAKLFQNKKYDEAIKQFKKAIALKPDSSDAYNYLGNAYLALDKTKEAIAAFKNLLRLNPNSEDAYKNLGNAYLQAKRYSDAETQFKAEARINPIDTYPPYTLGQIYLQMDRLPDAEAQFKKVITLARNDPHGYYGLGLAYYKMGRYDDAVGQLQQAIKLKPDFALAHFELGNAYLALDKKDEANGQLTVLKSEDGLLAAQLRDSLTQPQIIAGFSTDFNDTLSGETPVSELDTALATPSAAKDFSMTFQFNTEMDVPSVLTLSNWSISKAAGGTAGIYNNGITLHPQDEVQLSPLPKSVMYDPTNLQATVTFTIMQNADATAVVDPSHLLFKFSGTDVYGKPMDSAADEFDGFALKSF